MNEAAPCQRSADAAAPTTRAVPASETPLSPGEVYFLWSFIQGSIMVPEIRWHLRRAWGMCPRHGFGFLAVDAAFRHGWLHGPALLYTDLMERAVAAFSLRGPFQRWRLARRLRATAPCLMCSLGYGPHSSILVGEDIVARGSDLGEIRRFAHETRPYWERDVCGRCAGGAATARCREHLREELLRGARREMATARAFVHHLGERVARYARSFRWELRGTDAPESRAGLISAVGWCSGWGPWLGDWLR